MYTLFIARGYPTKKYITYGVFELDQAKALQKEGCKVVYAAVDVRSIRRWRKWGIEKKYIDGIIIYVLSIPLGRLPKVIVRKFSELGLKMVYDKITREQGTPDIIHAHYTEPAYSASKLKKKDKIPFVVTEHSSQVNKNNLEKVNPNIYEIAKNTYNKADSVIGVSPSLVDTINKNFNIKSNYIPNLVDLEIFKYKGKKSKDVFNFISVGNLVYTKRMDLLIDAFYKAFSTNPKIKLTIFGIGPKRQELERLVNKYNLNSKVNIMGLKSREEIADKLAESSCFVLPSQSETFGVAYIEALAVGVPVIATKCGGPETFVTKENGVLIDIDNEKQLIQAMKYMYKNNEKYDKEIIARNIENNYSAEVVANKIIRIYDSLLDRDIDK